MTDKEKIKKLEEEILFLKRNPASKFYAQLVKAIEYIGDKLDTKKLNLEEDTYAQSVITLSKESSKIFDGLQKGLEYFDKEQAASPKKSAKEKADKQLAL